MKRICTLLSPTPGLHEYRTQSDAPLDWDTFRREDRCSFRELRDTLAVLQHGLCGYCEINLVPNDVQIEHFIPQSDPEQGNALALDCSNLIACCKGGVESMFDAHALNDRERFQRPVKGNASCGQAKRNTMLPNGIDPRKLPALLSLFWVEEVNGEIVADASACSLAGFNVSEVRQAIDMLGLNAPRLKRARLTRLENLAQVESEQIALPGYPAFMENWVRVELLPDEGGNLLAFFTTRRSYFGPLAELILAEPPQAWI